MPGSYTRPISKPPTWGSSSGASRSAHRRGASCSWARTSSARRSSIARFSESRASAKESGSETDRHDHRDADRQKWYLVPPGCGQRRDHESHGQDRVEAGRCESPCRMPLGPARRLLDRLKTTPSPLRCASRHDPVERPPYPKAPRQSRRTLPRLISHGWAIMAETVLDGTSLGACARQAERRLTLNTRGVGPKSKCSRSRLSRNLR